MRQWLFSFKVLIDLSNTAQLDNVPRWLTLKEQSEGDHHRRSHSGQSRHSSKTSSQHSSPKTGSTHDIHDSPKSSVTKSRSHGVFPDPAKGRTRSTLLSFLPLAVSLPNHQCCIFQMLPVPSLFVTVRLLWSVLLHLSSFSLYSLLSASALILLHLSLCSRFFPVVCFLGCHNITKVKDLALVYPLFN